MSDRFIVLETPMPGLQVLGRKILGDARGSLSRLFDAEVLADLGWPGPVVQVNHTMTRDAGTVRGLHYQTPPFAEAKLVTCLSGRVLDVAVDVRQGSATRLAHFATELSAENGRSLLIGPGFAHGFQALSDNVVLLYVHSAPYRAEAEAGLSPLDPALGIAWPLPVTGLSDRDRNHPALHAGFSGVAA